MRFNKDRAIFLQIADHLTHEILAGRLSPGARLPSARELAVSLEVNPNTSARALQALADGGIARCERGLGYFVSAEGPSLAHGHRRERFLAEDLPRFLDTLDELDIRPEEIISYHAARKSHPASSKAGPPTLRSSESNP